MTHEPITTDHILTLASSPAVDPALVRYYDGTVEVRSLIERGGGDELEIREDVEGRHAPYALVVKRDDLIDIDDEWDGQEMSEAAAADVAEHINQLSREQ